MFEREREFVAPKAKTGAELGIVIAITVIIVGLVAFLVTKVPWIAGICAFLIVVPIYLNMSFKKEYCYSLVSDKLTVRLANFKGKKTDIGKPVFLENMVVCAMESDSAHNAALKDKYTEVIDARTSANSKTAAFAVFERDGVKTLIRFEPSDMMTAEMKKYAESKIFI